MKTITSSQNPIIKQCTQLKKKKFRDQYDAFLVEGDKLVLEAINLERVKYLLVREDRVADFQEHAKKMEKAVCLPTSVFEKITDTITSQGVVAVVAKEVENWETVVGKDSPVVVLDQLQDPGNIGTIIRTAEAAGYGSIMAIKGTGDVFSPKVVRAAAGSILRMPVIHAEDIEIAVNMLRKAGKIITVTSLDADMYFYQADLTKKTALVIGNEGHGVSSSMREQAQLKIKIPMEGQVESLNAAMAAGILNVSECYWEKERVNYAGENCKDPGRSQRKNK